MGLIEACVRFEIGHLDVLGGFGGWWSGDFGCLRGICCYVSVAGVWQEETFLMLPVLRTEKRSSCKCSNQTSIFDIPDDLVIDSFLINRRKLVAFPLRLNAFLI